MQACGDDILLNPVAMSSTFKFLASWSQDPLNDPSDLTEGKLVVRIVGLIVLAHKQCQVENLTVDRMLFRILQHSIPGFEEGVVVQNKNTHIAAPARKPIVIVVLPVPVCVLSPYTHTHTHTAREVKLRNVSNNQF